MRIKLLAFIGFFIFIFGFKSFGQTTFSAALPEDTLKVAGVERSAAFGRIGIPEVKIYPNPTEGELTIEFENPTNEEHVEILDLLGNKILELPYHRTMNLSSLPRGIYFLKLYDKNNHLMVMERILKK